MKRILPLCLGLFALLCGCAAENTDTASTPAAVVINLPKDNTVNGYRLENGNNTSSGNTGSMPDTIKAEDTVVVDTQTQVNNAKNYCGNKNSKVFHSSSCGSVTGMKEANKIYFENRAEFISNGYKPCGRCNP